MTSRRSSASAQRRVICKNESAAKREKFYIIFILLYIIIKYKDKIDTKAANITNPNDALPRCCGDARTTASRFQDFSNCLGIPYPSAIIMNRLAQ